jgi:glycosyltransferase involved in cell wall biosynthesis
MIEMTSTEEPADAASRPDVSLFFPVFNDEKTIRSVTEKSIKLLEEIAGNYEIIIVDDGSPDRSGVIADELSSQHPRVSAIHHDENRGYGEAIKTGLSNASYEWICFTDGDDEYDVFDFRKLMVLRDYFDLIITFRYVRLYSGIRIFISRVYNMVVRQMFRTHYRDISTGLRMVRRSVLPSISLESSSPFIGAELTIKLMLMGYRIGEVGIQTFPREFGKGGSATFPNIIATIRDIFSTYRTVFSKHYDLPEGRKR